MYKASYEDIINIRNMFSDPGILESVMETMKGENEDFYDGYFTGVLHCFDIYISKPQLRNEYHNAIALLAIAASKQFSNEFLEKIKNRPSQDIQLPNIEKTICDACGNYLSSYDFTFKDKQLKLCKYCNATANILFN